MSSPMLQTLKEPALVPSPPQEQYVKAYHWMLLSRTVEEKLASLWRGGKIAGGLYLSKGHEAVSAATGMMLKPGDIFGPLIRDQAGRLAFGEPLEDVFRIHFGTRVGLARGRDGNVHRGHPKEGYLAMISHLGALIPVVAGALIARRFRGQKDLIGVTCIGEGGTSTGAFHEGLNMAAVERLPLVLVVTNNQYAYSTPNDRTFACENLADRAVGYGIEGYTVDGTDLSECLKVIGYACDRARVGHGPQMVVASCLRLVGHGEHDDASYVDKSLYDSPVGRDCIKVAEDYLKQVGWADSAQIETWRQEAKQQIEEALTRVRREPLADLEHEDWCPYATKKIAEATFAP
jgi:TPP-dependent pyruvate/acetoin dehydrogenase alpha subunit